MREPVEFEVVGKNPVRQRGITDELIAVWPFATFHFGQVCADILRFYISQRNPATRNFEIRSADDGNVLRLVGGSDSFGNLLEQRLKRGAVRMLGGVTAREVLFNFSGIFLKCRWHIKHPVGFSLLNAGQSNPQAAFESTVPILPKACAPFFWIYSHPNKSLHWIKHAACSSLISMVTV